MLSYTSGMSAIRLPSCLARLGTTEIIVFNRLSPIRYLLYEYLRLLYLLDYISSLPTISYSLI
jgi:hypothetical protein